MPETPTYIVTGGAGFVGSNIVAALLMRDPRPRICVIDTFRTGSFACLVAACDRRGCGPFDGDLIAESTVGFDFETLLERLRPVAVIHEAAVTDTTLADEREMVRENLDGFLPILHACVRAGVPLAYASSAATYGTPGQSRDRVAFPLDAAGRPNNVYGFSKWLMECEHRRVARERVARGEPEPRVVGLRYFNVFGPGEECKGRMASMVRQLTLQLLAGGRPRLFKDGSQARDQVHVDDVVGCTLAAAGLGGKADPKPGVYNVGSGVATSFEQMVGAIRTGLGLSPGDRPTEYFDMPPEIRRFYQDFTLADIGATAAGLGWRPACKPVEGIAAYAKALAAAR